MIQRDAHAALDALSAVALIAASRGQRAGRSGLATRLAAAGLGIGAYSLLTRYRDASRAPISMRTHLGLDAVTGTLFCLSALNQRDPVLRQALGAFGLFSLAAATLTDRGPRPPAPLRQVPLPREALAPAASRQGAREVAPGLAWQRLGIVNVVFLGAPQAGDRGWVLVDAGLPCTARMIARAAAERFGPGARPSAIILTHGHFDHVGALRELSRTWDAPVYAHPAEHPYLSGRASYPTGDPRVSPGLMAALGGLYPTAPVDVSDRLRSLPADGRVPGAPAWRWLHTPGHAPGHVSLWRAEDRALVAGDAVITTRQESAMAVLRMSPEIHGPPAYFTPDWDAARASASRLADLEPDLIVAGHGAPMKGPLLRAALHRLARRFDDLAVPRRARHPRRPLRAPV
jgi:glyoxylase-like metal-dependent hydrolase (beta-lactamase superfamily II)